MALKKKLETEISVKDKFSKPLKDFQEELKKSDNLFDLLESKGIKSAGGINTLIQSFKGLKVAVAAAGVAFVTAKIAELGNAAINAASKMKELDNVTTQIFQHNAEYVKRWADDIDKSVGRSIYQLQNYASFYGSIIKSAGIGLQETTKMSKDLAVLTADMSSFFNMADDEIFTKLKGGLTGETEGLKQLGIVLNDTVLAEYALSKGIKEKWVNLDQATKVQLRYNKLMEITKDIQGDAARTIDGYANQLKKLEGTWNNILVGIGNKLLPSAEPVLHMFNGIGDAIDDLINKKNVDDLKFDFTREANELEKLKDKYVELSKLPVRSPEEEKERLSIINQLQQKYPGLLANISTEANKYGQVAEAIDGVIANLKQKLILQANETIMADIAKEIEDSRKKVKDWEKELDKLSEKILHIGVKIGDIENLDKLVAEFKEGFETDNMDKFYENLKSEVDKLAEIKKLDSYQKELLSNTLEKYIGAINKYERNVADETNKLSKKLDEKQKEAETTTKSLLNFLERSVGGENNSIQAKLNKIENTFLNEAERARRHANSNRDRIEGEIWDSTGKTMGQTVKTGGEIDGKVLAEHIRTRAKIGESISFAIGGVIGSITKLTDGNYQIQTQGAKKSGNGLLDVYGKERVGNVNTIVVKDSELDAHTKRIAGENAVKELQNINKNLKKGEGSGGSKGKKGGGSKKEEKNKWEQQIESLKKTLDDLRLPIGKFRAELESLNAQINKIEVEKLTNSFKYGDGKEADIYNKRIEGLRKQYQIALDADDKNALKNIAEKIRVEELLQSTAKIVDDIIEDVKNKTFEIKRQFSDDQVNRAYKSYQEYSGAKNKDIKDRLEAGLITAQQAQEEMINLINGFVGIASKMKDSGAYMVGRLNEIQQSLAGANLEYDLQTKASEMKTVLYKFYRVDELQENIKALESRRDEYFNKLTELEELYAKAPEHLKKGYEEQIESVRQSIEQFTEELFSTDIDVYREQFQKDFKEFSKNLYKNIDLKDITGSMGRSLKELIEKGITSQLGGGSAYKSQLDRLSKQIELEIEARQKSGQAILNETEVREIYRKILTQEAVDKSLSVEDRKRAQMLKTIDTLEDLENKTKQLGDIFSQLANATGSKTLGDVSNIFNAGMGVFDAFKSFNSAKGWGKLLPGINLLGTGLGVVNSILAPGKAAKKKAEAENEQRRQKAQQEFESKLKENENLIKSIKDLTGSIQDLSVKLIQNIGNNTNDANIKRQTDYYGKLLQTAGDVYDEKILASGHSSSRRRKRFRKITNTHYQNLETDLTGIFGQLWTDWARDSKSLQKFYDNYLSVFNVDELRRKMGTQTLDNHNIEQVKNSFLNFIKSVRTMEQYAASLPRNGILESFDGIEVADIFQLRKEYEEQLRNIYKGMGKDPDKYKEEILAKVNELVQADKVVVSAFTDVKNTVTSKLASGNDVLDSMAEGVQSYFNKIRTNLSKVLYDKTFNVFENQFTAKFETLSQRLADFRLNAGGNVKDFFRGFDFTDMFLQLRSLDGVTSDIKEIINTLRTQAINSGLGKDIVDKLLPLEEIDKKSSEIKNALKSAMERSLDTESFNQFSMSLGDSIYESVKTNLIEAFSESEKFKKLTEKYFQDENYKNLLNNAESFKEAYDIIKKKQDEVYGKLQAEGLGFKNTNATTGEYYGGLTTQKKYAESNTLASNLKPLTLQIQIDNKGFIAVEDFSKNIIKEAKEFMYKSEKEEVKKP